jgi:hypothetical protein
MLEVLGAGKPYFPVLLAPNAVNSNYVEGHPVARSVEDLRDALQQRDFPDFSGLLDDFAGIGEIPNPARTVWKVLGDKLRENRETA